MLVVLNYISFEYFPSSYGRVLCFLMQLQVPLSLFGGLGNYASALFLAASKANALDKVESEILDWVVVSKKSHLFSQFIEDLSVPQETCVKAVKELFSEAGFSDVTKNFLGKLCLFKFVCNSFYFHVQQLCYSWKVRK